MTNIVLIHTDDTGRRIRPYGRAVNTPNLTELAETGVTFRNAFCAGPTCSPSRASLFTGKSPHACGMIGLAHRGFRLDDYRDHLVQHLGKYEYETVLVGQQHEANPDEMSSYEAAREIIGYDLAIEDPPDVDDQVTIDHDATRQDVGNAELAAEYIRSRTEESAPFFLSYGLYNTHKDFPLNQTQIDPKRVSPPSPLPDVQPIRREIAALDLLIEYVDRCVGIVLDAIRDSDIGDTAVIFTTDHGLPLPYMKCHLRDGGTGVALLVRTPDRARAGDVEESLVSTMDLFPTICDFADVPVPADVEARSLSPILNNMADSIRAEVYSEVTYHAAYEPKRSIRTQRYKYIRRFDTEFSGPVLPNTDDGPAKRFLLEHGLNDRDPPTEALYDLYHDPNERENLIDDPTHADVYADLSGRLEEWMLETDDPLLEGPVSKPDGARANPRTDTNPSLQFEPEDAR